MLRSKNNTQVVNTVDTKQTLLVVIKNVIQSDSWADVDKQRLVRW